MENKDQYEAMKNYVTKLKGKSAEEIASEIVVFDDESRNNFSIVALSNGDKETSDNIDKANNIIEEMKLNDSINSKSKTKTL